MPPAGQWTDRRLDDAIKRLDDRIDDAVNEIRANRDLPKAVAEMAIQMKYVGDSLERCHSAQERLDARFESYVEDQDTLRAARFRFAAATVLAALGLVLTGVSLLIGRF